MLLLMGRQYVLNGGIVFLFPGTYGTPVEAIDFNSTGCYFTQFFTGMITDRLLKQSELTGFYTYHYPALRFAKPVTIFADIDICCHYINTEVTVKATLQQ